VVRYALDVVCCALATLWATGAMSGAAFLRIKKLKGGGIITVAARHNRRVIQAELGAAGSIDPTRSHLNETLVGPLTAADVGQLAKDLMARAGVVKLRKDAVMGLEIVFSLPPGHAIDERAYFADCAAWVGRYFGGAHNILSADIHRDEAAPHCHVLVLPLIDNRMDGSNMLGGKQKLMALQKDFHLNVASRHGLIKAPARLSGTAKQVAAKAVLKRLRETSDGMLHSKVWATLRDVIESDPVRFLEALGIEQERTTAPGRTMAQIFTSKGKGQIEKPSNPIGFTATGKRRTLCSVGFTPKPSLSRSAPRSATKAPTRAKSLPAEGHSLDLDRLDHANLETVRIRDRDLDPALYDPDSGEYFRPPPPRAGLQRQTADAWVAAALTAKATGARHLTTSTTTGPFTAL
jgi:Plasmid recombination enzyme